MKKLILSILLLCTLASADTPAENVVGGLLNGGIAAWGYVEARQHKEVRVYCNVMAVIFTLRSIKYFVKAAR